MPDNKVQDYEFDDFGNISRMVEMTYNYILNTTYYYDADNRLLMTECKSVYETVQNYYEYDGEGNMTSGAESVSRAFGTVTNQYQYYYNGKNQLVTVIDPGEMIYTYTYDVEGMRSGKVSQDGTVNFVYEKGYIILETGADGVVTAKNVWGKRLLYREADNTKYSYIFNGHGDIISLTDLNGNVLKEYDYDPYGREDERESGFSLTFIWEADTEAKFNNPFRYCGEYLDAETGFYYLRARYYDPEIGRFVNEDSARDGLNWYLYCNNNPVNFIDPSGRLNVEVDENGNVTKDYDAEEFGEDSLVYKSLADLTVAYGLARTDEEREAIHTLAEECRRIGRSLWISAPLPETSTIFNFNLSNTERVLSMGYGINALMALYYGNKAYKETKEIFGNPGGMGGDGDAYRHMLWSAYLSSYTNEKFATLWLNAHEFGSPYLNLSTDDQYLMTAMDLQNNDIGIGIGKQISKKPIKDRVYNALISGKGIEIENGVLVPTNGGLEIGPA